MPNMNMSWDGHVNIAMEGALSAFLLYKCPCMLCNSCSVSFSLPTYRLVSRRAALNAQKVAFIFSSGDTYINTHGWMVQWMYDRVNACLYSVLIESGTVRVVRNVENREDSM